MAKIARLYFTGDEIHTLQLLLKQTRHTKEIMVESSRLMKKKFKNYWLVKDTINKVIAKLEAASDTISKSPRCSLCGYTMVDKAEDKCITCSLIGNALANKQTTNHEEV